jgi:hypothetical protein
MGDWYRRLAHRRGRRIAITITERGEVDNVIFRTVSRFVFGYTSTMDSCLAAAGRRLA